MYRNNAINLLSKIRKFPISSHIIKTDKSSLKGKLIAGTYFELLLKSMMSYYPKHD